MMSDIVLNVIINANCLVETIDRVNVDDAIKIDLEKLESEGLLRNEVVKMIKKEFQRSLKNENFIEHSDLDLNDQNLEIQKVKNIYKSINNIFEKITLSLEKMTNILRREKVDYSDIYQRPDMNISHKRTHEYISKLNLNIDIIKKSLNN